MKTQTGGATLKALRKAKRLTLEQVGEMLDPPVAKQTIYKYETGLLKISLRTAIQLGHIFDVRASSFDPEGAEIGSEMPLPKELTLPLLGSVRAGYWAEADALSHDYDDNGEAIYQRVPMLPDDRFSNDAQYALLVDGPSINKVTPSGSYVACVRLEAYPCDHEQRALNRKLVHVERRRGDLVETTIKEFRLETDGATLWPVSDHPQHQARLILDGSDDVRIVGVVIGRFEPL